MKQVKKPYIGSLHPSEQQSCSSGKSRTSQQKNYPLPKRETSLINLSQQQRGAGSGYNNKNALGRLGEHTKEQEAFTGNRSIAYSSSPTSSSAAEDIGEALVETSQKKEVQQQPVARSRTTAATTFSSSSSNCNNNGSIQAAKKSATSTALTATQSMPPTAEASVSETSNGGMSFLRNNFPFFRSSTSRSRSQSVISDVSRSSETGESKKEKDKSYRRKSHLNRAFTDEPVPDNNYTYDATPKSSKPASQDPSSLESSAVEESRANHKPNVKLHPAIPSVLTINKSDSNLAPNKSISRNSSYSHNESIPSPVPTNSHKSSPVVKKDSFSDAEGVSFIKKMLQKEGDRDRAAAAAVEGAGAKQNFQSGGSCTVNNSNSGLPGAYNIKKSPSAGNQSYWSKFSNSQSAFLRKLFDKPKISESPANVNKTIQKTNSSVNCNQPSENRNREKDIMENEKEEPVLAFSVAQKASFFMKLEHEQRFSKWRKNSVDLGVISSANVPSYSDQIKDTVRLNANSTNNVNEVRPASRFFTPSEGNGTQISSKHSGNIDRTMEFGSLPRVWGNNFQSLENTVANFTEKINNETNLPPATSSSTDYGDNQKFEPKKVPCDKFDEISTRNLEPISPYTIQPVTPAVKSYSLTRSGRHSGIDDKNHQSNLDSFPMYHSASAIISTNGTTAPSSSAAGKHSNMKASMKLYKNLGNAYSSSSSSFSEAISRHESTKYLPQATKAGCGNHDPPTVFENDISGSNNDKRRGSASDLEMSVAGNQSPLMPRSEKVKSMFLPRNRYHCDADNLSEDGEVSSGGQEVAEIICRSYENSPVFRKKTWRTPKHAQSNFTKEIWRRCGNYENWSHRSQSQQQNQIQHPHHSVPQTFTTTTNVIEVTTIPPSLPSVAASPPPATSNLLQILTVLSSSNDELNNDPKPKSKKHRQGNREKVSGASSRSDSIPPIHPNHTIVQPRVNTANYCYNNGVKNTNPVSNNHRHTMPPTPLGDTGEVFVSVPHPEDEAFQSFFCSVKSYTQVTHYPPANGVIITGSCLDANNEHMVQQRYATNGIVSGEDIQKDTGASNSMLDIGSIQRESDLLVMKKNVPTCKRKSTGSKYKNPLRALAARMDFRQQGYTQTHSTNSNNMVQCSSDVDVST